MKALTLWQPYGSLVIWQEKEFETRGRRMRYRGPLAIHAAAKKGREIQYAIGRLTPYSPRLAQEEQALPYGAVLGIVHVLDCVPSREIMDSLSERERLFGNYGPDRWAIQLKVAEVFEQPIPAVGKQWLWNWSRTA